MHVHGSQVARDENPLIVGCNLQNFRIESPVRNCARRRSKIYRRFASMQPLPALEIDGRHQLESEFSSEPGRCFFLGLLKTIDHVLRHGILRLKLLKDAILIFQAGFDFIPMLQNEGDGAVNLCERSDGRYASKIASADRPRRKS